MAYAQRVLPFSQLGLHFLQVKKVIEEEWSYIPVGGPLPVNCQPVTAFGAAANLIHPATGYSIVRSLREAPELGRAMAAILKEDLPVPETSARVWDALWPQEKRRQVVHLSSFSTVMQYRPRYESRGIFKYHD